MQPISETSKTESVNNAQPASDNAINFKALSAKIDFRSAVLASRNMLTTVFVSCVIALFSIIIFSMFVQLSNAAGILLYLLLFVIVGVITYIFLAAVDGKKYLLATNFALDNTFEYIAVSQQKLNGIFQPISNNGYLEDVVKGKYANSDFWFATYNYTPNSISGQKGIQSKMVVSYELRKVLPNIVIDSKNNDYFGMSIPLELSKSQLLELEGDFINHFSLYVPKNFEREALYIITPDLMSKIVDYCKDYDIEIIGTELRFYSNKIIEFTEPSLSKIFELIELVGSLFLENTSRYKMPLVIAENHVSSGTVLRESFKARTRTIRLISMAAIVIIWTIFITYFLLKTA